MQTATVERPSLSRVPIWMWLTLAFLILFIYAVSYDQTLILHSAVGRLAESNAYLHEFLHDGRHLLGFPCH